MIEISTLTTINNIPMLDQVENQVRKTFKQTIILGLGNECLGDEGIGVHAARQLKESALPQTAKVVEVGTAILDTLLALKHAERIIVLDSLKDGGTPGTVYKIPLDDYNGSPCISSMHNFDLLRVMVRAGRKRKNPLPIMVFGVEPERIGFSKNLSPRVTRSLPYLIEVIQKELRN